MCGRYVIARSIDDLLLDVGATAGIPFRGADPSVPREHWNVAPTAEVPVVIERTVGEPTAGQQTVGQHGADDVTSPQQDTVSRELHTARWGLIPEWAKDVTIGAKAFNARSETVLEKPMFRSAVRSHRCAIPANGYYEWKKLQTDDGAPLKTGGTGAKQPYYIRPLEAQQNIWFAGLYEWWWDASEGSWVLSCSILTMQSPPSDSEEPVLAELGRLHERLPVALSRDTMDDWLDPRLRSTAAVAALLERVRAEACAVPRNWCLDPVDPAVGNVRTNRPGLTRPVDPEILRSSHQTLFEV